MGEIVSSGFNFGNLASLMNHWFSGETNLEWKLLKWIISPISPMPEKFNCPIQILEVTGFWTLIYQLIAHELRVQFRSGEQVEAMSTVCDTRHEPSQTFPLGENGSGSPAALVGQLFKTILNWSSDLEIICLEIGICWKDISSCHLLKRPFNHSPIYSKGNCKLITLYTQGTSKNLHILEYTD